MKIRLASVLVAIALWAAISALMTPEVLPGPLLTTQTLIAAFAAGNVMSHLGMTLWRVIGGLFLAMLIGVPLGVFMGLYYRVERALDLWVMIGLTIPSLCYALICFIWLGLNEVATIVAIGITGAPSIAINLWEGVKSIDTKLVNMARVFEASRVLIFRRVILPQVLPYVMASVRFGLGVIWKIAVLIELIGRPNGVGFQLFYWYQLADMTQVLAWTLLFTIVMLIIELAILKPIEGRLFAWRPRVNL
jgi:NitT/TauT family transport system permease protein